MKGKKIRWGLVLWVLVFLALAEGVLGLGLRPAKTTMDFVPGWEGEFGFWVVNNEGVDFEVKVYAEGELGEYIEIEQKELVFKEDEDSKRVNFKVKLPLKLPAGEVKGNIVVEEVLSGGDNPYQFAAKLVLKHKLVVNTPYPEKFVAGELEFEDRGEKVSLVSEVRNLGWGVIEKIKTKFYVNDRRERVDAAESEEESLGLGESKRLEAEIDKEKVSYGEFDILGMVLYDGYKLELEKKLIRGEPEVEILYFDRYFVLGKVNKFMVELLNKWNRKLEDVFVEVFVFKDGKEVDNIRTASFEIEGEERKKVEGYLDATGKELGDYDFEVVVEYGGKKAHQRFEGMVLEEEEYEEAKKKEEGGWGSLAYVLIGILFGLVIIGLGVLVWYKKEREEIEEGGWEGRGVVDGGEERGEKGGKAWGRRLKEAEVGTGEREKEKLEVKRSKGTLEKEGKNIKKLRQGNVFDRMGKS